MTENDDMEILPPGESLAEPDDRPVVENSRKLRWPLVLLAGAVLGFGASVAASWFLLRPTPYDDAALRAEIAALEAEVASLRNRPQADPVDLAPLTRRVRLLETKPDPVPIDADLVDRLEALRDEGFELPPPTDLSSIESRLDALEARPVGAAQPVAPLVDPAILPPFPAERLREGARELAGGGLIGRALSRHVRVKGDDDPLVLIDRIEADLAAGDVASALATFDALPDGLQSLARGWRADVNAVLAEGTTP